MATTETGDAGSVSAVADRLNAEYVAWIRERAASPRFGTRDRHGSQNLITKAARLRGARAVAVGDSASLSRTVAQEHRFGDGPEGTPGFVLDVLQRRRGDVTSASEHLEIDCHGIANTHLDGLNHVGLDESWYSGWPVTDAAGPDIASLAEAGFVTRALLLDIPAIRGTDFVAPDRPVSGEDLDAALAATGVELEPGDAILLYMGRDAWEAEGRGYFSDEDPTTELRPGVGASGARWLADRQISILLWDFMDAHLPGVEPDLSVHYLLWAVGLLMIDNCDFEAAILALRNGGVGAVQLAVAPLRVPGATGSAVNPIITW